MRKNLIITSDGSHTINCYDGKEHYHSVHGAITESMHVFIQPSLNMAIADKKALRILEIGFGTGLNAFLAQQKLQIEWNIPLYYHGIEAFPLDEQIYTQLNYPAILQTGEMGKDIFLRMHEQPWNETQEIVSGFCLHKQKAVFPECELPTTIDMVFMDAFSPDIQPELWSEAVFEKLAAAMKNGGVLLTYSAKGSVRRNMRAAGLTVISLPGPPGKREITLCQKV